MYFENGKTQNSQNTERADQVRCFEEKTKKRKDRQTDITYLLSRDYMSIRRAF